MPIGDYRTPSEKKEIDLDKVATPQAAPAPSTPAKSVVQAFEKTLSKDLDETGEVADKALSYDELLKEANLTRDQARDIQDALLVDGHYSETYRLTAKTSVTFRSRSYLDFTRYHQAIERYQPKFVAERDEITLRYFLAASLETFAGESFEHPSPDDVQACEKAFEVRHARVLRMPEAVVEMLGTKLNQFDAKMRVALSEGAVESF